MNAPIDVLAVMDASAEKITFLAQKTGVYHPATDLIEARAAVAELIEFKARIDAAIADLPWKDDCTQPGLYDIRDRTGATYRAVRAERHPSSGNLQCMGMNVSTMRNCGLGYQWRRIPDAALARVGGAP